ncbi:hypothetical protein [Opitutus sp. ER46]|uniref:hypothetical protein n=1 Tax=Opitutus sp. ER46 TaxID=2161864 RepID=UPI000D319A6D|nr:hypothetical protein [Opitutus sp. ER46]PTY00527.1 hypothetical protein DB354_01420 [Opitutus sp. ER46]
MPAQSLQTEGFILLKYPPGDSFQTLTVFSPEHGNLAVLQRIAKKPGTNPALDLFDEAALGLETSNQGRTYFLKEARLLTRHPDIGRSYESLRLACALATLIARNPVHEDSRPQVGALLRTVFAAFAASDRPDIVYLKGLYRFARDEGYPLKEQWFPTLPSADRAALTALLNRPLAEQATPAEMVAHLQRRLEDYLRGHTEIIVAG